MADARRVAIISGAGKGLGRAYARHLAAQGMAVVVNNRRRDGDDEPSADAVVREIRAAGGAAVAHYGAAEDPGTGESLLQLALDSYGRLDAVIANAGISEAATFHRQDAADIAHNITINLLGTAYLLLPTFRHLYQQRAGRVLVSTSAAGLYGEHGLPAYSASKAGIIGLMRSLALEGGPHGVFVNAIAPFARTQMTAETLEAASIPGLAPEAVAPIAAQLIAPDCELNGEVIIAADGRIARAAVMCSAPRGIDGLEPKQVGRALAAIAAAPAQAEHHGAVAMFRTFMADGR